MRIISGKYGGRRIRAPKNLPVRPTTDRVKEALFNIFNNRFVWKESSVLDLYAGTGNISFEFASRGVEQITSVDKDFGCIRFINTVSKDLGMQISTEKRDVLRFLEKHSGPYNIIFADPPYAIELTELEKLVNLVFENTLLSDDGTLVIEHDKRMKLAGLPNYATSRTYGGSVLSFFEHSIK